MRVNNKDFFRKTNWLIYKRRNSKFVVIEKEDCLDDEISELEEIRRLAEIESKFRQNW